MKPLRIVAVCLALVGCSADVGSSGDSKFAPPASQYGELMAACLRELGWDAEATVDGGVNGGGADGQEDQYESDFSRCESETGFDLPPEPMTDERAGRIFDEFLESARCVEEHGFQVEDPPSRETAIEWLKNGEFGIYWNPYDDPFLNADPNQPPVDIYALCPLPPSL